jgi:hypothetical protein
MGMQGRIQEDVMKNKRLFVGIVVILIFTFGATSGFSQVQTAQNRIPQQIIINGQPANGAYVAAPGGGIQSFTCSTPQQYVTPDGASQGWACYEQATGVWLLNALPPAQAQVPPAPVPQQPTVIYQQPPATVIYQQPAPTVVYTPPVYPVVVAPAYPPSVVLGTAAINAAGRIAAAAIAGSHYSRVEHYYGHGDGYGRGEGYGHAEGYGHGYSRAAFHGRRS